MSASVAATAATGCPAHRVLPSAITILRWSSQFMGSSPMGISPACPRGGKSAAVMTALTPGRASALLVSRRRIRAWGCGLCSTVPWRASGTLTSAPYLALPVTMSTAASLGVRRPITLNSLDVVAMVPPPYPHRGPRNTDSVRARTRWVNPTLLFALLELSKARLSARLSFIPPGPLIAGPEDRSPVLPGLHHNPATDVTDIVINDVIFAPLVQHVAVIMLTWEAGCRRLHPNQMVPWPRFGLTNVVHGDLNPVAAPASFGQGEGGAPWRTTYS